MRVTTQEHEWVMSERTWRFFTGAFELRLMLVGGCYWALVGLKSKQDLEPYVWLDSG